MSRLEKARRNYLLSSREVRLVPTAAQRDVAREERAFWRGVMTAERAERWTS